MSCTARTDFRDWTAKRLRSLARIGESRKETQRRLSRELGWTHSRVFCAWHRRARMTPEEIEHLRDYASRGKADAAADEKNLPERIARLEKVIAGLEAKIATLAR